MHDLFSSVLLHGTIVSLLSFNGVSLFIVMCLLLTPQHQIEVVSEVSTQTTLSISHACVSSRSVCLCRRFLCV
jgi:hypothetical protein